MKKFMALLIAVLIFPLCITMEGTAEKKPSLNVKQMTIGIGSYGVDEYGYYAKDQKYYLSVRNSKKGATYTFTSKDKKIATVKKEGSKAYITGVKAGKTAITVKQKLNGKTTTIGTCNITVKNATLVVDKELLAEYELGIDFLINKRTLKIKNYNPEAKYTFISNKEGIVITEKEYEDEGLGMNFYHILYTATKPGTYKITVKETYKKKTRKVGTFNITIKAGDSSKTGKE